MNAKVKKVKVSFTLTVNINDYMNEYGLDDEKQAAESIRQDAENAARAQLESLGFLVNRQGVITKGG